MNTTPNLIMVLCERQKNLAILQQKETRTIQYNQICDQIELIESILRVAGDSRPIEDQLDTNFAKAIS